MVESLLSLACHLYGAAGIVYLAYLARQRAGLAIAGRALIGLGLVAHGLALGRTLVTSEVTMWVIGIELAGVLALYGLYWLIRD